MEVLRPGPGRLLVDGTVGDGGHASAWLEAGGLVLGTDRDPEALLRARRRCASWADRLTLHHARFSEMDSLVAPGTADAVLLDLGTSRLQIDSPIRGFSYTQPGALDMRMDGTSGPSAAWLLAHTDVGELASWLREYGDVPRARRLARAILHEGPPTTTEDLARIVTSRCPPRLATKTLSCVFQALRMVVNGEREELQRGLEAAIRVLAVGGRLAVLTYHSGEERLVRVFLRRSTGRCTCPPGLPVCACSPRRILAVIEDGRRPSPSEVAANPRARSARLWAAQRLEG